MNKHPDWTYPEIIKHEVHADERGFVFEQFRLNTTRVWDQQNVAFSCPDVLRGLHFQRNDQAKLISVARGQIYDAVVDVRRDSPSFGQFQTFVLELGNRSLFIPPGFAHGFLSIGHSEVRYLLSRWYDPRHEFAIDAFDPLIGIVWPTAGEVIRSQRDRDAPPLSAVSPWG